jgi:DNA-binding NarL/FixJ family response regulator
VAEAAVGRLAEARLTPLELLEQVARRIRCVVPYAGAGWLLTDPATMVHAGAFTEDVPPNLHLRLIENELGAEDVAKFSTVAGLPTPVARLSDVTGGALERSARYAAIYAPAGYRDELRVAFRTRGGACLAVACLARACAQPPFTASDAEFMARIAPHVAEALRGALVQLRGPPPSAQEAPGVLVLDVSHAIESLTATAERWLRALPADGRELPAVVYELARAAHARGVSDAARARMRLSSGEWLRLSAAALREPRFAPGRAAIVIEPVQGSEVAPLVAALHELTAREQEIADLIAQGLAIDAIAGHLFLSEHTVRDHVKAVFHKLGVRSRPELTAKLLHG